MTTLKIDASPNKKETGVPKDPEGRKAYYERIMATYAAQNPVKFQAKKAELEKKAEGFEYIAGKWVNIFDSANLKAEIKLTASQKEQALEQEKIQRVAELEARNKELEEKLGALEAKEEDESEDESEEEEEVKEVKPKPKGRPKKTK